MCVARVHFFCWDFSYFLLLKQTISSNRILLWWNWICEQKKIYFFSISVLVLFLSCLKWVWIKENRSFLVGHLSMIGCCCCDFQWMRKGHNNKRFETTRALDKTRKEKSKNKETTKRKKRSQLDTQCEGQSCNSFASFRVFSFVFFVSILGYFFFPFCLVFSSLFFRRHVFAIQEHTGFWRWIFFFFLEFVSASIGYDLLYAFSRKKLFLNEHLLSFSSSISIKKHWQ